jgi:hypothetical protein
VGKLSDKLQEQPDAVDAVDADARVKLLRQENKQLRDRLRIRDAGLDIALAAFNEAYSEPLEIPIIKPPKDRRKLTEEGVALHWTDIHFGKETKTYNSTKAAERVLLSVQACAEVVQLRRRFARVDHLTLLLGGDFPEGDGAIFPGQAHEIDQDFIEQVIKFGPEKIAGAILSLLQIFPTMEVQAVPGNHGRQGKFTSKRNNADSIFYEIVRLAVRVANPSAEKRITWNLPLDREPGDEWFASFKICDRWGGLLVHGDQVRGQLGFPWYGYGKKVAGWASCLPPFDYLFAGHFHTHAAFDLHGRHVLSTGSTESDNAYAKENHAASGSPKQRLCFFNTRLGLLADHQLHLDEREPRR